MSHTPPHRPPVELIDRWMVARTPRSKPYPCMCATGCWGGKALKCQCRGRTDVERAPSRCCGHLTARPIPTRGEVEP